MAARPAQHLQESGAALPYLLMLSASPVDRQQTWAHPDGAQDPCMSGKHSTPLRKLTPLFALWAAAVVAGFVVLWVYQARPAASAAAPRQCPANCRELLDKDRPTLVVCAHPQCPCTRATLNELDRIAARCTDRLRIAVLFTSEPELGDEWTRSGSWTLAARIPGVDVREDRFGIMAHELGARTSGEALLYSADGYLRFQGGITGSRGHEGDNAGADGVVEFVRGQISDCPSTPVFGCRLVGSEDESSRESPQ